MDSSRPVLDEAAAREAADQSILFHPAARLLKRIVDVSAASVLLFLLAPLFGFLCWRIRAEDQGAALYAQSRVGMGGRVFRCYKFRTMDMDAEETLESWRQQEFALFERYRQGNFKLRNDPRTTRLGRFLRASSLDELPQLLNILRGEMTLIGPRPLLPREIGDYGAKIQLYYRTRPGLTGLWQVSGRSETTFRERADLDEYYILNWSAWLDLRILLKTVAVVFGRRGAY